MTYPTKILLAAATMLSPVVAMAQTAAPRAGGAAQVTVQPATPNVTVQQPQPNVTVNQPQPEITVHQPAPTVTVDIPQPQITIRMPKPQVDVAMGQPQVQVSQARPDVRVEQAGQPNVNVQRGAAQPNVTVQDAQQAPKINYTSEQAKVTVNQARGEPSIKIERDDANRQAADAASSRPAIGSASSNLAANTANRQDIPTAGPVQALSAARILNMNVVNARGDVLGDVEHVLQNSDRKAYVVVGHGGFLGMGEKQVMLPVADMVVRDNRLMLQGMTDEQIRAMPAWNRIATGYNELSSEQAVQVRTGS